MVFMLMLLIVSGVYAMECNDLYYGYHSYSSGEIVQRRNSRTQTMEVSSSENVFFFYDRVCKASVTNKYGNEDFLQTFNDPQRIIISENRESFIGALIGFSAEKIDIVQKILIPLKTKVSKVKDICSSIPHALVLYTRMGELGIRLYALGGGVTLLYVQNGKTCIESPCWTRGRDEIAYIIDKNIGTGIEWMVAARNDLFEKVDYKALCSLIEIVKYDSMVVQYVKIWFILARMKTLIMEWYTQDIFKSLYSNGKHRGHGYNGQIALNLCDLIKAMGLESDGINKGRVDNFDQSSLQCNVASEQRKYFYDPMKAILNPLFGENNPFFGKSFDEIGSNELVKSPICYNVLTALDVESLVDTCSGNTNNPAACAFQMLKEFKYCFTCIIDKIESFLHSPNAIHSLAPENCTLLIEQTGSVAFYPDDHLKTFALIIKGLS